MPRPTEEQLIAVEKFRARRPLKIAAFAGAGKTTTLKLLAQSRSSRGIYLAFNRAIAAEARGTSPRNVNCRTTHAIAFRAVMPLYGAMAKMTRALHAKHLAELMEYRGKVFSESVRLNGVHQAHLILGTIRRFCQSADQDLTDGHIPRYGRLLGIKEPVVAEIRRWALDQSKVLWARMTAKRDEVPLGHDGYLKLWALSHPKLAADYILLDEAQDTNLVVLGVLKEQGAQIVYVGDKHQQIYEWRGAVNAMERITGCSEAFLTQSFRFGNEIAGAASRVLATLGEKRAIRGNPAIASRISAAGNARTVLARTNAGVILEILEAMGADRKACVVGGTKDLTRLLSDLFELKAGKPGVSPEFFGFQNWSEVVAFAETEEGESIRTFVQLVEQHGERKLWAAVRNAHDDERSADVILSTAHKAKGCEWDSVRLAPDFLSSRLGSDPDAASEVRLFYVAMTRAKKTLIVDSATLAAFMTGAWKSRQPEQGPMWSHDDGTDRRPGPQRPARPVPRLAPLREVISPTVQQGHPGAAPKPSASAASDRSDHVDSRHRGDPTPRPVTPERPSVAPLREVTSPTVRQRHPGAAPKPSASAASHRAGHADSRRQSDPTPRPVTPVTPSPPGRFLNRVARLFGASWVSRRGKRPDQDHDSAPP